MQKRYYQLSNMGSWLTTGVYCVATLVSSAQGLINNGARIVITNSSNIYIDGSTGHFTNQAGGLITNNTAGGTISLLGNWANNASNTVFSNDGSTVVFKASTAQAINGTNSTDFYNITANGTGQKTFNTASTVSSLVSVGDNTTVNANGKLTLLATANSNASVGPLLNNAAVTGNVYVQVYFTGNNDALYRGTRAFSSPVTEAVSKIYAQLKNYMVITGKSGGGFDPGGVAQPYGASLTKYNESATLAQSQFAPIESISTSMAAGEGTFLFYRGSRANYSSATAATSNKVNAPFAAPENVTMQYYGPINQQNVVVTVPYTNNAEPNHDGYKLIGNPYPAVINWTLLTKINMENELKIIKPAGGFATYKNGVVANALGSGNILYIMPGQAFYVRSKSGGGSVTFTELSKSLSDAPMRFMSAPKNDQWLAGTFASGEIDYGKTFADRQLRINLQNDLHTEEAVTVFKAGSLAESDKDDAVFFGGSSITFSTIAADDTKLTINFMPEIAKVQDLKLSVNAAATGPVKLNFTDISAAAGYDVLLQDNFLNTVTNVRENPVYDFTIDKSVAASFGNERFKVLFKPLSTATNLVAKKTTNGAELSWGTVSGSSQGKYEIERSADGVNFIAIGGLNSGLVSTSYEFLDSKPLTGGNYYRLKQVDEKGNTFYSSVAFLDYRLDDNTLFTVYPNPASHLINVDMLQRSSPLVLSIHDLQGRELARNTFAKDEAIQQNVTAFAPGIYIINLRVEGSKEVLGTAKFIKE